jgi:hypothetical protein
MYGKKMGMDAKSDAKADDKKQDDAAKLNDAAKKRAVLLVDAMPLLPKDFDADKSSDREIMVAALGDALKDKEVDGMSDDYVKALFDSMIERRKAAGEHISLGYNDDASAPETKRRSPIELRKARRDAARRKEG